ncbi:hypothetical protein Har1130_11435 [Haloarcula sp. CBA1130]|uniref:DUF7504 family protein n=1 Tax=unclassified Haloarcula TaxID=2624677 RepID=UPI0012487151|nr:MULTISPECIES: hypothetical protein [unclassified Haloarcula]KAA9398817.1 hypothetical protein Har1129_11535 [Haloarcula sp. CBA1129]KAA9403330.1 hypothetical protein Har1130_11435 [Haloarcula sp. CBA1130]
MSSLSGTEFEVPDGIGPLEGGTSVLLTGDDTDALESVFARVVAPADGERSVVLATDSRGRTVKQSLNSAKRGAGDRSSILTAAGSPSGDDIKTIDDLADLTGIGMEFSALAADSQQDTDRFRTGIFLCSTLAGELDDTRSLYRFLNSTFLTEVRRSDGIGVCAIDTSADIGANMDSTVTGLKTSFKSHVDVETTGRTEATLTISDGDGETSVDVSI